MVNYSGFWLLTSDSWVVPKCSKSFAKDFLRVHKLVEVRIINVDFLILSALIFKVSEALRKSYFEG